MNIAYMILAHHQPKQLSRLVDRLNQSNVHFFIHVDKKSPAVAAIRQAFTNYKNVQVVADHEVNWMGFTTIDAEVQLMQLAYNSGIGFKYYVLMSGQDYPIKSNSYINDFFAAHTEDFISINSVEYMPQKFRDKTSLYHFRDIPYINPRNPKRIGPLVYLYFGIHRNIIKRMPRRTFYKGFQVHFGSQWFALHEDTVRFILQFLDTNPGYIRSMKNTDGPDEIFFHTIVMNTERRKNISDYDRYAKWLETRKGDEMFVQKHSSLRYMDWSERGKSKPAVLDLPYFETLKNSTDLYARKVDEKESAALLDMIDEKLL